MNSSASQHNRGKNKVESLNNQKMLIEATTSKLGNLRMLVVEGLIHKLKLPCRTQKEEQCKCGSLLTEAPDSPDKTSL